MAQTKNKTSVNRVRKASPMSFDLKRYLTMDFIKDLLYNPKKLYITCWALLIFEVFLNIFIIQRIKYTEIDWIAYMQEVGGVLNGTLDYSELKGDTGPLVYPAGFVYVYSLLYYITNQGENIRLAQYIFLSLYILQSYITFEIYKKTQKIPPYALILSTITSYRIHSIYVLRLFNDPFAVFFFYLSLTLFLRNQWILGSILYSFAVSIKMNILLYAPSLLIAYLTNLTYLQTILNLFICGVVQLILGAPFLWANFWGYIKGSFDLGRIFEHKWTVNYRFLPRDLFENKNFHVALLVVHVSLLILFYSSVKKYFSAYFTIKSTLDEIKTNTKGARKGKKLKQSKSVNKEEEKLSKDQQKFIDNFERQIKSRNKIKKDEVKPEIKETMEVDFSSVTRLFVLPFFVANLIGITCARSLHYQFYSWYFHSLLYLVHSTPYRKPIIFLLLAVVEFCWNTYPSTNISSALLHICHFSILYGVYKVMNQK
ncbi:lethal(2)neighbour of tid protein [Onthophagus taurus]|uniref:lethal(2)neighbour of tid protein n=1 Tax=Onthophagus taurus TaxID=166361 RepID=UPI0039BEB9EE